MTISRIKQIKRILKDADVRFPHNTIDAIRAVVVQPKPERPISAVRADGAIGEGRIADREIVDRRQIRAGEVAIDDARLRLTEDTAHRGSGTKAGERVSVPKPPFADSDGRRPVIPTQAGH